MEHLTIIQTSDLVDMFESAISSYLGENDAFELFQQLFDILDKHSPLDMSNRAILLFDRFVFTNHLTVDRNAADEVAYAILVQLYKRLNEQHFYVNQSLMFFPYLMVDKDLAVRRFNN